MKKIHTKNIKISAKLIERETNLAFLIRIPNSAWRFWHPKNLSEIIKINNKEVVIVRYFDNFKFNIFKIEKVFGKREDMRLLADEFEKFVETSFNNNNKRS